MEKETRSLIGFSFDLPMMSWSRILKHMLHWLVSYYFVLLRKQYENRRKRFKKYIIFQLLFYRTYAFKIDGVERSCGWEFCLEWADSHVLETVREVINRLILTSTRIVIPSYCRDVSHHSSPGLLSRRPSAHTTDFYTGVRTNNCNFVFYLSKYFSI